MGGILREKTFITTDVKNEIESLIFYDEKHYTREEDMYSGHFNGTRIFEENIIDLRNDPFVIKKIKECKKKQKEMNKEIKNEIKRENSPYFSSMIKDELYSYLREKYKFQKYEWKVFKIMDISEYYYEIKYEKYSLTSIRSKEYYLRIGKGLQKFKSIKDAKEYMKNKSFETSLYVLGFDGMVTIGDFVKKGVRKKINSKAPVKKYPHKKTESLYIGFVVCSY